MLQGGMLPETLTMPEPRAEPPFETGEWIVERPGKDVQQELYEETLRGRARPEPYEAPKVETYQRMDAKKTEEEKGPPREPEVKPEEKSKEEIQSVKEKEEAVPPVHIPNNLAISDIFAMHASCYMQESFVH